MSVTDIAPVTIPIVQPSADAPAAVRAAFSTLLPGSVAVAREIAGGAVSIDYEGGLYTRPANQPPTPAERSEYAQRAAGRALTRYPTIARFGLPGWKGLEVIGQVDYSQKPPVVTFYSAAGPE